MVVILAQYTNGLSGTEIKKDSQNSYTYFHKDALGSTMNLTNETGNVVMTYGYDVFGKIKRSVGNISGNYKAYTGKELDTDSGLMYYGARYYNSDTGRFITADSFTWGPDDVRGMENIIPLIGAFMPNKLNNFTYVSNNPINKIDPDGHDEWSVWLGFILNAAGAAATVAGSAFWVWFLAGVVIFISLIVFLMRWNEKDDKPKSGRDVYLAFAIIFFLLGCVTAIASAFALSNLALVFFFISLMIMFAEIIGEIGINLTTEHNEQLEKDLKKLGYY